MEVSKKEVRVATESTPFITSDALLKHWQGHRRLTRRGTIASAQRTGRVQPPVQPNHQ